MKTKPYTARFSLSGKVVSLGDTRLFAKGFKVRRILVEAAADADKFSNTLEVSFLGDNTGMSDRLKVNDYITVCGKVVGHYSECNGNVYYHNVLSAEKIAKGGKR